MLKSNSDETWKFSLMIVQSFDGLGVSWLRLNHYEISILLVLFNVPNGECLFLWII